MNYIVGLISEVPIVSIYADIEILRKLRVAKSLDGQYLWQAGLEVNSPSTFLGAPIYVCGESGFRVRHSFRSGATIEKKIDIRRFGWVNG